MATHYWPGESITVPQDFEWDSTEYDTLPTVNGEVGYDNNAPGHPGSALPGTPTVGGNVAVFQIVGSGADVQFYAATGSLGLVMQLMDFDLTYTTSPYGANGWWKNAQAAPTSGTPTSAAIKAFLVSGKTYYLRVASYGTSGTSGTAGTADYVSGYGQVFLLRVSFPLPSNDLRNDAADVIIAANGNTFKSPAVLNTGYTYAVNATDDPSGSPFQWSAWWRYRSVEATTFTAQHFIGPEGFPNGGLAAYRMSSTGAMSIIEATTVNGGTVTGHADAAETIYFVIGLASLPGATDAAQTYELWVTGGKSIVQAPSGANPNTYVPPVTNPPWTDPSALPTDPFDPSATQPELDSGEDTLLNLVRAFSTAVKRAVRITGPTTIEMVDPAVPLPAGWSASDAQNLYHSASTATSATDVVLSTSAGDVTVTGSAELVADDVRLVRSSWRIPDRLPFYGLPPAAVQRVTYTFSPQGFRASVDFHFPAVPFAARRS